MTTEQTLTNRVSDHAERLTAVETTQVDHGRRLEHHGRQLDRINGFGWLLLGGIVTNILVTVWKR